LKRVRDCWWAVLDAARRHPGWALLVAAVVLVALGWGGYAARRQFSAQGHLRQARTALDDGDTAAATGELEACLRVWPDDPEIHLLLARNRWTAGDRAGAEKELLAAKAAGGDAEQLALEAHMAAASGGDLERVEVDLRKRVEERHPEKRYVLEALVRGYLVRGRAEDAERFATLWIDDSPGRWQPWLLRGIARGQLSRDLLSTTYDRAKDDFRQVLELKPDNDLARFLLGNAYVMTGQFREALPHLQHYCGLKPDDPQGIAALAGCQRALGSAEDARRSLDDWLRGHTGTAEVFLVRGEAAMDLGNPEEALGFFRQAEALGPPALREKIDFQLAGALRAAGRPQEADGYEQKWRTRNQLRQRLKELEGTAAKEPQNVAARHEAGTISLRLDDEPAGMRWFASALKIDPSHKPTHQALAEHFQRKGNLEAAAFHHRLAAEPPK
jgi:tetratricopeptide (TPR) repeat protein